jgi:alpha-beta hydrolase superfamily lysophospholipase
MNADHLDHPMIRTILFYPRPARPGTSHLPNAVDGTIPVAEDVALGYRLFKHEPGTPLIVLFHGNGEIAPDYDHFARDYHRAGASLLVVDYRGYGWSSGQPRVSTLLADAERVAGALPGLLREAGLGSPPLIVMGRSLGSAPAIHLAHAHPDRFAGLIVESGFADIAPLLAVLGVPPEIAGSGPDPVGNRRKMAEVRLPLLVIHGERDTLIPVDNGQALYDASPAANKRILRVRGAGHNDLLMVGIDQYFAAIAEFIQAL